MLSEHCFKYGSQVEDVTSNYKITTSPSVEWNLVIRRERKSDSEFESIIKAEFPRVGLGKDHHNRRIPDVAILLHLPSSVQAKLTREEVIAIVLYTGPLVRPILDDPLLAHLLLSYTFSVSVVQHDPASVSQGQVPVV